VAVAAAAAAVEIFAADVVVFAGEGPVAAAASFG
jgi:hypothetical protein